MNDFLETYYRFVPKLITVGIILYFILFPKRGRYLLSNYRRRIDIQLRISGLLAIELIIVTVISFILDKDTIFKFIYSGLSLFWLYTSIKDFLLLQALQQVEEEFESLTDNETNNSM